MQILIVGVYGVNGGVQPNVVGMVVGERGWGGGVGGGWGHAHGCMKICLTFMSHLVHNLKMTCSF